jgi:hypothetical protein
MAGFGPGRLSFAVGWRPRRISASAGAVFFLSRPLGVALNPALVPRACAAASAMAYILRGHIDDLGVGVDDGGGVSLTSRQARDLVVLLVIVVLVVTLLGLVLRSDDRETPAAAFADAVARASARPDDRAAAEQVAEAERGLRILMDTGGLFMSTGDFNALNKSPGEPVLLLVGETELRVTPTRVTAGAAACAAGSLTVELLVERVSGSAGLTPDNFALVASDGSAAAPVRGCSTGFAEASARRTLVFAGEQPDRLIVGTDPVKPVAVWHLP